MDIIQNYDLSSLHSSVGKPLNPEAVVWGQEAFGLPTRQLVVDIAAGASYLQSIVCCKNRKSCEKDLRSNRVAALPILHLEFVTW